MPVCWASDERRTIPPNAERDESGPRDASGVASPGPRLGPGVNERLPVARTDRGHQSLDDRPVVRDTGHLC